MKHCSVDGCKRARYARQEVCEPHYRRLRRTGSLSPDLPIGERREPVPCGAPGCDRTSTERGLCHGHYLRLTRTGDVQEHCPLQPRAADTCGAGRCDRRAVSHGLCRTHANRKRKFGDVQADKPIREVPGTGFESHGYWYVPVPPELRHYTEGQTPYPEHRLAMAMLLGRPLRADESVHHVNGDRRDNRVTDRLENFRSGNLELWSRWQPSGQRVSDKIKWALELLDAYASEFIAAADVGDEDLS